MNDDNRKVTVCSECLQATCWQGIFCCDNYRDAGTVDLPVWALQKLALENPVRRQMTEAQEEVFERVNELLKEHFEGYLISVVDENEVGKITTMQYHGGLLQAIGLARASEHKMLEHQADGIEFRKREDEEDEE
jgi:hypothetical protein